MRRLLVLGAMAAASLRAETYFLTVAGLGGEQEYEQRFTGWAKDLEKLLQAEPGAKSVVLSGKDATKANIEARLKDIAGKAKADDEFTLMLIGHGTYDDREYKFNIPGPDITGAELGALLDKIQAHVMVVNMTSASGGATAAMSKPRRVVISATKSGTEKNATVFPRYFIEALRDPAADTDKNDVLTATEAFKYAEEKTAKFYESQNRLATEHPLIEDAGKGEGVKAPTPENGQGQFAGRFAVLHLGAVAAVAKDPAKLALLKKKEDLESQIDDLKYRKAALDSTAYRRQLQQLLIQLSTTQEELDK